MHIYEAVLTCAQLALVAFILELPSQRAEDVYFEPPPPNVLLGFFPTAFPCGLITSISLLCLASPSPPALSALFQPGRGSPDIFARESAKT